MYFRLNARRIWASTPQIADYRGLHGLRGFFCFFVDFGLYLWYTLVKETALNKGVIKMADQDFWERVLESLAQIEAQAKENNARLEKRLDSLDTRVGTLERDVGWIKGKLEGK